MGYLSALDMADQTDLDTALSWHLRSNHFPPVPAEMIGPCKEAIEAYHSEDLDRFIKLPDPITWRDQDSAPAWAIIEGHHLDAFLGEDLFYDEDE